MFLPKLSDARMQDTFELLSRGGIGKDEFGNGFAIQASIIIEHLRAESGGDFGQSRLAGFDHRAGEIVGIDDWYISRAKELSTGGFAHPNTTGQAQEFHGQL
jgi:hypothetical protein